MREEGEVEEEEEEEDLAVQLPAVIEVESSSTWSTADISTDTPPEEEGQAQENLPQQRARHLARPRRIGGRARLQQIAAARRAAALRVRRERQEHKSLPGPKGDTEEPRESKNALSEGKQPLTRKGEGEGKGGIGIVPPGAEGPQYAACSPRRKRTHRKRKGGRC